MIHVPCIYGYMFFNMTITVRVESRKHDNGVQRNTEKWWETWEWLATPYPCHNRISKKVPFPREEDRGSLDQLVFCFFLSVSLKGEIDGQPITAKSIKSGSISRLPEYLFYFIFIFLYFF